MYKNHNRLRLPSLEEIDYVFEKAIEGNEMAATLINEWNKGFNDFADNEQKEMRRIINQMTCKL